MCFCFSHVISHTYSWASRNIVDAFGFSVGWGNSCCPGSSVFLLELSEQNVFCILADNEGAFWLTSGQLANKSTDHVPTLGSLNVYMYASVLWPEAPQGWTPWPWTSDGPLLKWCFLLVHSSDPLLGWNLCFVGGWVWHCTVGWDWIWGTWGGGSTNPESQFSSAQVAAVWAHLPAPTPCLPICEEG